jgi:hypothetical protein
MPPDGDIFLFLDGAHPMMKGATRSMPMALPDGAFNFGGG